MCHSASDLLHRHTIYSVCESVPAVCDVLIYMEDNLRGAMRYQSETKIYCQYENVHLFPLHFDIALPKIGFRHTNRVPIAKKKTLRIPVVMEDCWTKRMCGLLAHTTQFSFLRCVRGVAIHVCTANDVAQCASLLLKREIMLEFTSGLNARCASQAERITRAHLCGTRAQYMHLRRERAHMFIV